MFLAKIWLFILSVAAVVALAVALVIPRPAERATRKNELAQIDNACRTGQIVLRNDARQRIQKTSEISTKLTAAGHSGVLAKSSSAATVPDEAKKRGKEALNVLSFASGQEPDFILLLDNKGRLVAHRGKWSEKTQGAYLRGYFLVNDALDGFVRDDVWTIDGKLYLTSASPIVKPNPFAISGALVIGQAVDTDYAKELSEQLGVDVGFYVDNRAAASSSSSSIHKEVTANFEANRESVTSLSCGTAFSVEPDADSGFDVVSMQLPGEAGSLGAFLSVISTRDMNQGFAGSFAALTKSDMSFSNFPWILLGIALIGIVGIGMALLWMEVDKPMKALAADAVSLAKGESSRFDEMQHKQRTGSVARSVNIALDRLQRDAKDAKKDLDELLGPAPNSPSKTSAPSALEPLPPPPPADFQFSSGKPPLPGMNAPPIDIPNIPSTPKPRVPTGGLEMPVPSNVDNSKTPVPKLKPQTDNRIVPKPISLATSPSKKGMGSIDEDILGLPTDSDPTVISDKSAKMAADAENVYFREVFDDYLVLKRKCGESTESLTFEKFAGKLASNRDALISKHGCKSVRFQVYVKDGKAALKASPVK